MLYMQMLLAEQNQLIFYFAHLANVTTHWHCLLSNMEQKWLLIGITHLAILSKSRYTFAVFTYRNPEQNLLPI